MVRDPSVCDFWAGMKSVNEQVARDEDEVNRVQIRCEILQATTECYPKNNGIRFAFLKSHFGCNVENELDGTNTERGHCSNKGE